MFTRLSLICRSSFEDKKAQFEAFGSDRQGCKTPWKDEKNFDYLKQKKGEKFSVNRTTLTFDSWSILYCTRSKLDFKSICIRSNLLISFTISFWILKKYFVGLIAK